MRELLARIKAVIRRLRQGLAPTGHDVLIETVRGFGYCFQSERSRGLS